MARWKRTPDQIQEDIKSQSKVCCVCEERKPFSEFYNYKNKPDGKSYRCKACDDRAREDYRKKDIQHTKRQRRKHSLMTRYGMTIEEYNTLLESQDFSCAICGKHYTENVVHKEVGFLSVDRCHTTRKVRGLLCNRCNRGLGMLGDSSKLLKIAYDYLVSHERDSL